MVLHYYIISTGLLQINCKFYKLQKIRALLLKIGELNYTIKKYIFIQLIASQPAIFVAFYCDIARKKRFF